jgi:hypothetical protein
MVIACLELSADAPDLSGRWQLDSSKSKFVDEKTLDLDIEQQGNQITINRTYQDEDGKQVSAHLACTFDGKQCEFDDHGHKAKLSVWYDGSTMVLLKTDGDKRESTVEWHIKLANSGNTLNVTREIMQPVDKTEQLVFTKSNSLAAR